PLERKIFAYYISRAIEAGRDIYWRQLSRSGLQIRELLEGVYEFASLFDPVDRAQLEEYLFKVELNHSNFDHWGRQKFVPRFRYDELVRMAQTAEQGYANK